MPSAVQKRPCANGRSPEMTSTWVLFRAAAASLNLRVEVAQVGVSRLGTMFRTLRLPSKAARFLSLRRAATRLKSGAVSPTLGRLPATLMALPPRVTVVMRFSLKVLRVENFMGRTGTNDSRLPADRQHQALLVPQ